MISEILSGRIVWLLLVQSTLCLAAGLITSGLLRRHAAKAHQVLVTALLAAGLLPGTYLAVRHFELGLLAPPAAPAPQTGDESFLDEYTLFESLPVLEAESEVATVEVVDIPATAPVADAWEVPWATVGLIAWIGASAVLLGRLLLRFALGLRLLDAAKPVETPSLCEAVRAARERMGVAREIELRSSENVRSPIIWCWRRVPVLLVQPPTQRANVGGWVAVFCHELAHWKRLDHISGLLAELLTAALPWHPLTWWAKGRLSRLSEEVCDDWVVASGYTGVDYAESLLDLAPQSEMAFVPTVVGKERVMKQRIRRIVKDRCANPTIGKWWTLGMTALVVGIVSGVAFAQPGRAPRELGDRPPGNQALVLEGRRNVLERMLDQLRDQTRETEMALRELGEAPSERRQLLRAELAALHSQIERTERQLASLAGPEPPQPARPAGTVPAIRRSNERLLDLRAQAEQDRQKLDRIDDPDSLEAQELRELLAAKEQEIREVEMRLDRQRRRAAAARQEATEAALQAREQQARARRLAAAARAEAESARRTRLEQLQTEIRHVEMRLRELAEQGQAEGDEGHALRNDLRIMRNELRDMRQTVPESAAPPVTARATREQAASGARARTAVTRTPGRHAQREALQETAAAVEQRLARLEDQNGDEARQLRRELENLHAEIERVDRQISAAPPAPARRPATGRALEAEIEELRGQVNGLNEQMQEMQDLLRRLLAQAERSEPTQY